MFSLLLPASIGFGRTIIIQEAFGQFALPQLEEPEEDTTVPPEDEDGGIVVEEEEEEEPEEDTTPPATTNYTNNIQDPSISRKEVLDIYHSRVHRLWLPHSYGGLVQIKKEKISTT